MNAIPLSIHWGAKLFLGGCLALLIFLWLPGLAWADSAVPDLEPSLSLPDEEFPSRRPPGWLYPDLQTLPPTDLRLVVGSQRKLLRLSNSVANVGAGDLDVRGEYDRESQSIRVTQFIQREDGSHVQRPMGTFVFHAPHNHWHWEGFSLYRVWSLDLEGGLKRVVASSDKVSYCLRDMDLAEDYPTRGEVSPRPEFGSCGWKRQGVSAGWIDTYRYHLPGQFVDISTLPDGRYALESIVDPGGLIAETSLKNNSAIVYFDLNGNKLEYLGEDLPRERRIDRK